MLADNAFYLLSFSIFPCRPPSISLETIHNAQVGHAITSHRFCNLKWHVSWSSPSSAVMMVIYGVKSFCGWKYVNERHESSDFHIKYLVHIGINIFYLWIYEFVCAKHWRYVFVHKYPYTIWSAWSQNENLWTLNRIQINDSSFIILPEVFFWCNGLEKKIFCYRNEMYCIGRSVIMFLKDWLNIE